MNKAMTDLRTAAQQALEAMEKATRFMSDTDYRKLNESIDVLKAALAEPVQEPVAWYHVPYPGSGISPMVSLSQQHEPSIYGAVVPLYLKEQL